jgi:hypothetical protein
MPGGSRSLPDRPSLRHLKLEAKRRLAAGEFPTLHDAQVAIAQEYGLPTWAALKQRVSDAPDSPALDQLRWIIARFQAADQPGWQAPEDDELSQHFDDACRADHPHDPGQLDRNASAPRVDQPIKRTGKTPMYQPYPGSSGPPPTSRG